MGWTVPGPKPVYAVVIQLVECLPSKQDVASSSLVYCSKFLKFYCIIFYAVCPGGEGAVLKIVGCNRLAGSNPVHGAILYLRRYFMNRNKLYFENRINLLSNRDKENTNIIKKLQRQLRKASAENK